ncbi:MAG: hypothetical protein AAGU05_13880, partial [Anaerolineaceae bacterium]
AAAYSMGRVARGILTRRNFLHFPSLNFSISYYNCLVFPDIVNGISNLTIDRLDAGIALAASPVMRCLNVAKCKIYSTLNGTPHP